MRVRVVAVASAKGSPGCTFVAVNLARRLADAGLETLLVDADAEARGAASMFGAGAAAASGLLTRAARLSGLDPEAIERSSGPVGPRLRLLELEPSGAAGVEGRELVSAALDGRSAIVLDLGHLHGPLQHQLAAAADWLLWVVSPDRQGLERADAVLAGRPLGGASPGLVLNRISGSTLRGAEAVLVERHRMPVMARLLERRAVATGPRQAHRARAFRSGFSDLARTVHPDIPRAARTWP